MFTFGPHIRHIHSKASQRLSILKALAGSSWGHQKETPLTTYNTLIRPILTYASPIWSTNASPSGIAKLQAMQNAALCICTGSVKMSPISHLHNETHTLPLSDKLELLNTQFLAYALQPHHPSHQLVTADSGPRRMKTTLQSACGPALSALLTDERIIDPDSYRSTLSAVHTSAVERAITRLGRNALLDTTPPAIDPSETSLGRAHRTALSQLRSGYCARLNSYRHRIGLADSPLCPDCSTEDHTVGHLFQCPSHPTSLELRDLWCAPCEVVRFLRAGAAFGDLPPVETPPRPILPEPPRAPPRAQTDPAAATTTTTKSVEHSRLGVRLSSWDLLVHGKS